MRNRRFLCIPALTALGHPARRGGRGWAALILTLALAGVAVAGAPPEKAQGAADAQGSASAARGTTAGMQEVEQRKEQLPRMPEAASPFAIVGGEAISQEEYHSALHEGMRRKFFHGAPSREQVDAYRREVAQGLIDRVLLRQEAARRGLAGDDLLRRLEDNVRRVSEPGAEDVRGYYDAHPDKFTVPERLRVSLILLKVEPSATGAAWKAAEAEAARLVDRLLKAEPPRRGAEFAELARLHSGDVSASKGGDLGYVHKGMLAGEAQQVLDGMKPGDISAPLLLLQGVAVLRLEARVAPALSVFDAAKSRARDLLARERGDVAWQALIERLRGETPVTINEK